MKKLIVIVSVICFTILSGNALAFKSYYNNNIGYDNKIPYKAFFNGHSPKPEKIAVEKGRVQAVVPINTPEEKPQEGEKLQK